MYGGRLPVHVRCLLDKFANIGQIPNFDKLIATIRSREISASIILQSQSQLKTIYKDAADTIVGNCDTTLFLGGKEKSTLKEISELLGKETIDSFNQSENRGSQVSHGLNYQKLGKELIQLIIEKNNLHDFDTWIFFKWIFKTFCAVLIVTNTWNIVMAVFDVAQNVGSQ